MRGDITKHFPFDRVRRVRQRACDGHRLPKGVDSPKSVRDRPMDAAPGERQRQEQGHCTAQTVTCHIQRFEWMLDVRVVVHEGPSLKRNG